MTEATIIVDFFDRQWCHLFRREMPLAGISGVAVIAMTAVASPAENSEMVVFTCEEFHDLHAVYRMAKWAPCTFMVEGDTNNALARQQLRTLAKSLDG